MTVKTIIKRKNDYKLVIKLRFDDDCKNGHKSFAITGTLYNDGVVDSCGCIHDTIVEFAPELQKYIKWHLCGEHEPMYYIQNTVYLAGDRDCHGRKQGEVLSYKKALKFDCLPIRFKLSEKFIDVLETVQNKLDLELVKVPYKGDSTYSFAPKYTFNCFDVKWHECPFDTFDDAMDFLKAVKSHKFTVVKTPHSISAGKERDLEGARKTAIWFDATDEELSQEPEALTAALKARLPKLMEEFKADMQELGLWEE